MNDRKADTKTAAIKAVKDLLRDTVYTKELIEDLQEKRIHLINHSSVMGIRFDKERISSTQNHNSRVENITIQIDECEQRILKLTRKLIKKYKDSLHIMDAIEDSRTRLVITKHYIDGKTTDRIAAEMGYSIRHVQRLISRGIDCMAEALIKNDV